MVRFLGGRINGTLTLVEHIGNTIQEFSLNPFSLAGQSSGESTLNAPVLDGSLKMRNISRC
jgi:hypothetical protein